MSWVKDLWQILQTVATLTKEVERSHSDIKELRQDMKALTVSVNQLKSELKHTQDTTRSVLDSFRSEVGHAKEGIAAKFDVLTTRIDLKIADFEHRLPSVGPVPKNPRSLKGGTDL